VDCTGVRASGATRSTGRSLTRAESADAFPLPYTRFTHPETACCWLRPRVTPV